MDLPRLALSVRQPWTFALAHGWKDIENRSWRVLSGSRNHRGEICLHASKGMTQDEYRHCAEFCAELGFTVPAPHELQRGGIVGVCRVIDIVKVSDSPWFFGPRGLVIADARPVPFIPARGALDFFEWKPGIANDVPAPARWMLPKDLPAATEPPEEAGHQLALL